MIRLSKEQTIDLKNRHGGLTCDAGLIVCHKTSVRKMKKLANYKEMYKNVNSNYKDDM